jgi:hypothetical protein
MKNNNQYLTSVPLVGMTGVLAMFLLFCSCTEQATAPRISAQLFGEETKADIVGYQSSPMDANARAENALAVEIVTEAFNAAGKTPVVNVLPSRQLAKYALTNNDAAALIGGQRDLTAQEASQYRVVTFYLQGRGAAEEPVSLIFSNKHARANELHQAFSEGLQKIVNSGKYLEMLEKHHGKEHVPAGYFSRLKRHNPNLK